MQIIILIILAHVWINYINIEYNSKTFPIGNPFQAWKLCFNEGGFNLHFQMWF